MEIEPRHVIWIFLASIVGGLQGMTPSAEMMADLAVFSATLNQMGYMPTTNSISNSGFNPAMSFNVATAAVATTDVLQAASASALSLIASNLATDSHESNELVVEELNQCDICDELYDNKVEHSKKCKENTNSSSTSSNGVNHTTLMSDLSSTQAAASSTKLRFSKQCSMQAFKTPSLDGKSSLEIIGENLKGSDKDGIYSCPGCNYKNKLQLHVVKHMQRVLGLREYKCEVTGCRAKIKSFNTQSDLAQHDNSKMHKLAVAEAAAILATSSDSPATTRTGTGSTISSSSSSTNSNQQASSLNASQPETQNSVNSKNAKKTCEFCEKEFENEDLHAGECEAYLGKIVSDAISLGGPLPTAVAYAPEIGSNLLLNNNQDTASVNSDTSFNPAKSSNVSTAAITTYPAASALQASSATDLSGSSSNSETIEPLITFYPTCTKKPFEIRIANYSAAWTSDKIIEAIREDYIERNGKEGKNYCPFGCRFKGIPSVVKVHMKANLNKREVKCDLCNKTFNTWRELKVHKKSIWHKDKAHKATTLALSSGLATSTPTATSSATTSSSSSSSNSKQESSLKTAQALKKRKAENKLNSPVKKKSRIDTSSNFTTDATNSNSSSSSSSTLASLLGLDIPPTVYHEEDAKALFQMLPATPNPDVPVTAVSLPAAAAIIAGHDMPVFKQKDIHEGNAVSGTININGKKLKVRFISNPQQRLIPTRHCNVIDEARSRAALPAAPVPVDAPASVLPIQGFAIVDHMLLQEDKTVNPFITDDVNTTLRNLDAPAASATTTALSNSNEALAMGFLTND